MWPPFKMRMLTSLVSFILLALPLMEARGPPEKTAEFDRQVIAKAGDTVRLNCPVKSDPDPIFSWFKDDESIHQGWDRFRILTKGLRIKNIEVEDSGIYQCRATNGFGSVDVEYVVFVKANNVAAGNQSEGEMINIDEVLNPGEAGIPPQWTHQSQMLEERHIRRPAGSMVRLHCRASGHPRPAVLWFYKGRVITGDEEHITLEETGPEDRQSLSMINVLPINSGNYMCRAFNQFGRINFTYTLEVVGLLAKPVVTELSPSNGTVAYAKQAILQCVVQSPTEPEIKDASEVTAARYSNGSVQERNLMKPIVIAPGPENATIQSGASALFRCRIYSDDEPHIQWLKRIDDPKKNYNHNSTIKVNGTQFVVLKTEKVWPFSDGSYINKLNITKATESDSGMYVCLGANRMGYNYRSAYLTVLSEPTSDAYTEESGFSIPLLVVIPAVILIVIIIIIICFVRRKSSSNTRKPPIRQQTRPPPQIPVSEKPHNYAALPGYNHMQNTPSREQIVSHYPSDAHSHSHSDSSQKMMPVYMPQQRPLVHNYQAPPYPIYQQHHHIHEHQYGQSYGQC